MWSCTRILSHTCKWKVSTFIAKWTADIFRWLSAAWCFHTKLCQVAWNASTNNSETMYRTDLKFGEVEKRFDTYNFASSWPFSWNDFQFIFFCCVTVKISRELKWITEQIILRILINEYLHSRITTIPCAVDHNPLHFKEKCIHLPIRDLLRSFTSGSLAAAAINYYFLSFNIIFISCYLFLVPQTQVFYFTGFEVHIYKTVHNVELLLGAFHWVHVWSLDSMTTILGDQENMDIRITMWSYNINGWEKNLFESTQIIDHRFFEFLAHAWYKQRNLCKYPLFCLDWFWFAVGRVFKIFDTISRGKQRHELTWGSVGFYSYRIETLRNPVSNISETTEIVF